jgi:hypothetical protein
MSLPALFSASGKGTQAAYRSATIQLHKADLFPAEVVVRLSAIIRQPHRGN